MLGALLSMGAGALGGGAMGMARKSAGTDAGNSFGLGMNNDDYIRANQAVQDVLKYQGSNDALDPLQSSRTATKEVQNNPLLAQLFGAGGAMERAGSEEQNLASRGFSLQPEDYEAYGQASGNIAREFDTAENGLAQALANRGMSNSGVAGQQFMSSQGNKLEQLSQVQSKIANDRMQNNLQRLTQTRNFLTDMGAQGAGAVNDQYNRQMGSEKERFNQSVQKADTGQAWMKNVTGQGNEQLQQRQQTQELPNWAQGIGGALQGASAMGSMFKPAPTAPIK